MIYVIKTIIDEEEYYFLCSGYGNSETNSRITITDCIRITEVPLDSDIRTLYRFSPKKPHMYVRTLDVIRTIEENDINPDPADMTEAYMHTDEVISFLWRVNDFMGTPHDRVGLILLQWQDDGTMVEVTLPAKVYELAQAASAPREGNDFYQIVIRNTIHEVTTLIQAVHSLVPSSEEVKVKLQWRKDGKCEVHIPKSYTGSLRYFISGEGGDPLST